MKHHREVWPEGRLARSPHEREEACRPHRLGDLRRANDAGEESRTFDLLA
jgi:hypothetical protein